MDLLKELKKDTIENVSQQKPYLSRETIFSILESKSQSLMRGFNSNLKIKKYLVFPYIRKYGIYNYERLEIENKKVSDMTSTLPSTARRAVQHLYAYIEQYEEEYKNQK